MARSKANAYGKPSSFGRSGAKARTLVPWGNIYPARQGRQANSVGATPFRAKVRSTGGIRKPTPNPAIWGMAYPKNDPVQWPVVPNVGTGSRSGGSNSGMTQAKADFHNAVVNRAFQRGGYAG
jgi:hypothetical protein